jgi:c-di-GMP-binding flagellar brake protein YcgR
MGKPLEVWTRDISAGGIGVVSPTPLPVGGNFVVRLPQAEGTAVYLLCTVQNCTTLAKTAFVIGSTFAEFAPAPAVPLG